MEKTGLGFMHYCSIMDVCANQSVVTTNMHSIFKCTNQSDYICIVVVVLMIGTMAGGGSGLAPLPQI